MDIEHIIQILRENGARITSSRRATVNVLYTAEYPLSVQEILDLLKNRGVSVNKTTVYRELEFLQEQELLEEVQFSGEPMKRYELALGVHHHHIQCIHCGAVADVDMPDELKNASKRIKRQTGFRVIDHSLEFRGICAECAAKQ